MSNFFKTLAASLLLLAVAHATAINLYMNDKLVEGVQVESLSMSQDEVRLTVSKSDTVPDIPVPEPDPVPEPEPEPQPDPEPQPVPPGGRCVNTTTVSCGYSLTSHDWNRGERLRYDIVIPGDKTLVSRFVTGSDRGSAKFTFIHMSGEPYVRRDFWISAIPGGKPVQSRCHWPENSSDFTLRVTNFPYKVCELKPNSVYFLNVKHSYKGGPASRMIRVFDS